MLLHIDGSDHRWFQDERRHDLIVILDDATSEIYYARTHHRNLQQACATRPDLFLFARWLYSLEVVLQNYLCLANLTPEH
jgi:hypothetical protein